jgi:hypothetical protein
MIGNEGVLIKLTKGGTKFAFDHLLNTKEDFVCVIKMVAVLNQVAKTAIESKSMIKIMSAMIKKLHKILVFKPLWRD